MWENVKLPADTVLIPGVISHATNIVEHPELVAERIVRLAGVVGRENVIAGTDCGFAQGPFHRRVHPSHHVGEAGSAGRGRAPRQPRAVAQGGVTPLFLAPARGRLRPSEHRAAAVAVRARPLVADHLLDRRA